VDVGARLASERVRASAQIEALAADLADIADGSYGRCVRCGQQIGAERLDARPTADVCVDCAATLT
jgi:DnaK suppressor protein